MLFNRWFRAGLLGAVLVVVAGLATTAQAAGPSSGGQGLRLMMVEQTGCHWCARWNAEIAPAYPKTPEGKLAPLMRVELKAALPEGIHLSQGPARFTPTFVLLKDGQEVGRIQGYPGEDFFWPMLDELLKKAGADVAPGPDKS